jgi:hypothetical protein
MRLNCGAERHHYSMFNVGRSMFDVHLLNFSAIGSSFLGKYLNCIFLFLCLRILVAELLRKIDLFKTECPGRGSLQMTIQV